MGDWNDIDAELKNILNGAIEGFEHMAFKKLKSHIAVIDHLFNGPFETPLTEELDRVKEESLKDEQDKRIKRLFRLSEFKPTLRLSQNPIFIRSGR